MGLRVALKSNGFWCSLESMTSPLFPWCWPIQQTLVFFWDYEKVHTQTLRHLSIQTINHVQKQCYETITKVNDELDKKFLAEDVMGCTWGDLPHLYGSLEKVYFQPIKLGSTQIGILAILDWIFWICKKKDRNNVQCLMGYRPTHEFQFTF